MMKYIAQLINSTQEEYAKLIQELKSNAGSTNVFDEAIKILTAIYESKSALLDTIYKKL
jgi:hypothetical protein